MKTIWMQHNGCDKWDQTSAKLKKVMKPWCIYLSLQGGRANTEHSFLQVSLGDHSHRLHLHILQDWISISFTSKHTLKTEFQSQLGNLCPQRQFLQTVAVLWEALLGPLDRDVWEGIGFSHLTDIHEERETIKSVWHQDQYHHHCISSWNIVHYNIHVLYSFLPLSPLLSMPLYLSAPPFVVSNFNIKLRPQIEISAGVTNIVGNSFHHSGKPPEPQLCSQRFVGINWKSQVFELFSHIYLNPSIICFVIHNYQQPPSVIMKPCKSIRGFTSAVKLLTACGDVL